MIKSIILSIVTVGFLTYCLSVVMPSQKQYRSFAERILKVVDK